MTESNHNKQTSNFICVHFWNMPWLRNMSRTGSVSWSRIIFRRQNVFRDGAETAQRLSSLSLRSLRYPRVLQDGTFFCLIDDREGEVSRGGFDSQAILASRGVSNINGRLYKSPMLHAMSNSSKGGGDEGRGGCTAEKWAVTTWARSFCCFCYPHRRTRMDTCLSTDATKLK